MTESVFLCRACIVLVVASISVIKTTASASRREAHRELNVAPLLEIHDTVGKQCASSYGLLGTCKLPWECKTLKSQIKKKIFPNVCGYDPISSVPVICCAQYKPDPEPTVPITDAPPHPSHKTYEQYKEELLRKQKEEEANNADDVSLSEEIRALVLRRRNKMDRLVEKKFLIHRDEDDSTEKTTLKRKRSVGKKSLKDEDIRKNAKSYKRKRSLENAKIAEAQVDRHERKHWVGQSGVKLTSALSDDLEKNMEADRLLDRRVAAQSAPDKYQKGVITVGSGRLLKEHQDVKVTEGQQFTPTYSVQIIPQITDDIGYSPQSHGLEYDNAAPQLTPADHKHPLVRVGRQEDDGSKVYCSICIEKLKENIIERLRQGEGSSSGTIDLPNESSRVIKQAQEEQLKSGLGLGVPPRLLPIVEPKLRDFDDKIAEELEYELTKKLIDLYRKPFTDTTTKSSVPIIPRIPLPPHPDADIMSDEDEFLHESKTKGVVEDEIILIRPDEASLPKPVINVEREKLREKTYNSESVGETKKDHPSVKSRLKRSSEDDGLPERDGWQRSYSTSFDDRVRYEEVSGEERLPNDQVQDRESERYGIEDGPIDDDKHTKSRKVDQNTRLQDEGRRWKETGYDQENSQDRNHSSNRNQGDRFSTRVHNTDEVSEEKARYLSYQTDPVESRIMWGMPYQSDEDEIRRTTSNPRDSKWSTRSNIFNSNLDRRPFETPEKSYDGSNIDESGDYSFSRPNKRPNGGRLPNLDSFDGNNQRPNTRTTKRPDRYDQKPSRSPGGSGFENSDDSYIQQDQRNTHRPDRYNNQPGSNDFDDQFKRPNQRTTQRPNRYDEPDRSRPDNSFERPNQRTTTYRPNRYNDESDRSPNSSGFEDSYPRPNHRTTQRPNRHDNEPDRSPNLSGSDNAFPRPNQRTTRRPNRYDDDWNRPSGGVGSGFDNSDDDYSFVGPAKKTTSRPDRFDNESEDRPNFPSRNDNKHRTTQRGYDSIIYPTTTKRQWGNENGGFTTTKPPRGSWNGGFTTSKPPRQPNPFGGDIVYPGDASTTTSPPRYRPKSTKPPLRAPRISEQKCAEYRKLTSSSVSALPLTFDSQPVSAQVENCPQNGVSLIVGGREAVLNEFPHMVAIGYRNRGRITWSCGGTLISDNFVLTAAHCIKTSLGQPVLVRLGELTMNDDYDGAHPINVKVDWTVVHPEYREELKYNDIGLIQLETSVSFNSSIRPACLHQQNHFRHNEEPIATGWGMTDYGGKRSDTLLKVGLSVINNTLCNQLYDKERKLTSSLHRGIVDTMVCAGKLEGGKDTCLGDSGGPLQIQHPDSKCQHYVVGVTSFGKVCAQENSPGVYTRVSSYLPWIEQVVWK